MSRVVGDPGEPGGRRGESSVVAGSGPCAPLRGLPGGSSVRHEKDCIAGRPAENARQFVACSDGRGKAVEVSLMENVISSRDIQVERKHFFLEFRENERGRFLRITEEAHGRRNTVIIPSTGIEEFQQALAEVCDEAG